MNTPKKIPIYDPSENSDPCSSSIDWVTCPSNSNDQISNINDLQNDVFENQQSIPSVLTKDAGFISEHTHSGNFSGLSQISNLDSQEDGDSRRIPKFFHQATDSSISTDSANSTNTTSSLTRERKPKITLSDFNQVSVLGKGGFGTVTLVKKISNENGEINDKGIYYAMKSIKKDRVAAQPKDLEHVKAERNILEKCDFPFMLMLYYAFKDENKLYFVTEFAQGGELYELMNKQPDNVFSEKWAKFYLGEIALGLGFLHSKFIIYRDLKPENVLLCKEGHIKIADFGLCKENVKETDKCMTLCGTAEYMAPEIILKKGHNKEVDWWTFGILMWDMLMGQPPFVRRTNDQQTAQNPKNKKQEEDQLKNMIVNTKLDFSQARAVFTKEGKDLVKKLLRKDPNRRLGCGKKGQNGDEDAIKSHPFFQNIDFDKLLRKEIIPPHKKREQRIKLSKGIGKYPLPNTVSSTLLSPYNQKYKNNRSSALIENFNTEFTNDDIPKSLIQRSIRKTASCGGALPSSNNRKENQCDEEKLVDQFVNFSFMNEKLYTCKAEDDDTHNHQASCIQSMQLERPINSPPVLREKEMDIKNYVSAAIEPLKTTTSPKRSKAQACLGNISSQINTQYSGSYVAPKMPKTATTTILQDSHFTYQSFTPSNVSEQNKCNFQSQYYLPNYYQSTQPQHQSAQNVNFNNYHNQQPQFSINSYNYGHNNCTPSHLHISSFNPYANQHCGNNDIALQGINHGCTKPGEDGEEAGEKSMRRFEAEGRKSSFYEVF